MTSLGMTGTVGVAGLAEMTEAACLTVSQKAKVRPANDIIEEIARKKTRKEIDNVIKTAQIADIGSKTFLEYARVGIKEYELSAEMEYAMRKAGADDNFTLLSSGKHRPRHAPAYRQKARGG